VDYRVQLATSTPHYGGRGGGLSAHSFGMTGRVAKLYLPSGGKYFGSREGHGLTYTSCQETGKRGRLWRALGAKTGMEEKTIRRLMKGKAA
jgi:3-methyladenine DNA glycosylase Mpg